MMVDILPIESREQWLRLRRQDVTASAAAAVIGKHPWMTHYALWCLKAGLVEEDPEETKPMRRGRLLEDDALTCLQEDRPNWKVWKGDSYYRDPVARIGATPDAFALDPDRDGRGVVQIKTVEPWVFKQKWFDDDGELTPPLWIAIQATVEAKLTGSTWAVVAPLVVGHGLDIYTIEVPLIEPLWDRLVVEVADFWRSIAEGRRPDPDYRRDLGLLEELYQPSGEIIDLTADNELPERLDRRALLGAEIKAAEAERAEIKAMTMAKMGNATWGRLADGRFTKLKRIRRKGYFVDPGDYVTLTTPKRGP